MYVYKYEIVPTGTLAENLAVYDAEPPPKFTQVLQAKRINREVEETKITGKQICSELKRGQVYFIFTKT